MKFLIFVSSIILSSAANAGVTHKVSLEQYLFIGNLTGMTDAVQEQLAKEIVTTCGMSAEVRMNNLSINFVNGSGGTLDTNVSNVGGKLLIGFPAHPKVVITASFECP